jgi:uncharacterized membrane protein YgaE (UPF0421/DUF939 family)
MELQMLDQNITTLLAALIGGFLSVLGGFIANYYMQSSSNALSKRKEIRNMLEQTHKKVAKIKKECLNITEDFPSMEKLKKSASVISENLEEIDLLINFYLPPLKSDFTLYKDKINGLTETYLSSQDISEYYLHHNVYKASDTFQLSIVKLFNKEGYNYF